ncbi:tRNA 5-methoxyuridine(34)/uridine 5-oxyacetic acid(34) synthase CmoB [Alteromonas gilva]|uniref:tRNA U34 carboxymethyltransferase n=1 Tax=Alteromonas gilva TaxID=2987522 RepID=A0ABT5L2A9_9ALTE|nr:tRNA 5-methoxyuridine(34)/uridine 5-oxyacetic acid(34) synthase CmoB [Alteromonas gilva]MDC8831179.1 tRNA 5-methoxyuridine(34)/uridine 5-oxyacetic acid(34) synthase CmoB [Alteromonas gilva]
MTASALFHTCYQDLLNGPLSHWLNTLPQQMDSWYRDDLHGEFKKWQRLLGKLPQVPPGNIDLRESVTVGDASSTDPYTQKQIEGLLRQFMPWRKGPYFIHGVHIDTEWRSDWKWERLKSHIEPLKGKQVLDVGCGSGYHLWRMYGEEAAGVYGIDPTQLFFIQFMAVKHFLGEAPVHFLPLGIEQMQPLKAFDTVFSMGVLYHRKDPMEFLNQLKSQLVKGGQLVLETLIVDGDEQTVLMAGERYAQMRNVWFLPSTSALIVWLKRLGFSDCKVVDESVTSTAEQRTTSWMESHSLQDFLDPDDHTKTIEGYPAPKRAVIIATKN